MELIDLFYSVNNGQFKLACPSARLVVAPHYHEVAFEGSGFIRVEKSGRFEYELLVSASELKWIQEINHCIPHDAPATYFQLQLVDQNGIEWLGCEWVRPYLEYVLTSYTSEKFAIKGTIDSLLTGNVDKFYRTVKNEDLYQFVIPNVGYIPWGKYKSFTTNTHENETESISRKPCYQQVTLNETTILIEKLDDTEHIKVTISSEAGTISPFIDIKILESLIFVTGKLLYFGTQLRSGKNQQDVRIVSQHKRLKTIEFPPIRREKNKSHELFWKAFECFLSFLLKNDWKNPLLHPLTDTLIPIMEAGSRSEGIYSLTLSVAVESIAQICEFGDAESENKYSKTEISDLKKYIKNNISNCNLKNRLNGSIDSILSNEKNTADRLRSLVKSGVITQKQFKSWQRLRHTSAHGGFVKNPEMEDYDEIFGDVYTMVNTIILRYVGYQEEITDYGAIFHQ